MTHQGHIALLFTRRQFSPQDNFSAMGTFFIMLWNGEAIDRCTCELFPPQNMLGRGISDFMKKEPKVILKTFFYLASSLIITFVVYVFCQCPGCSWKFVPEILELDLGLLLWILKLYVYNWYDCNRTFMISFQGLDGAANFLLLKANVLIIPCHNSSDSLWLLILFTPLLFVNSL